MLVLVILLVYYTIIKSILVVKRLNLRHWLYNHVHDLWEWRLINDIS